MKVKVSFGKSKKITISAKDLIVSSVEEVVEEKLKTSDFKIQNVKFNGDKCEVEVSTGDVKVVDIDEKDLIDKSIKQILKEKLKLKSVKNLDIEVISPGK